MKKECILLVLITYVRQNSRFKKAIFEIPLLLCIIYNTKVCRRTVHSSELQLILQSRTLTIRGTRWRSWLRHCTTSRKVAGSIPDGAIGIFD